MNIEEFIPINKKSEDINQMTPLVWAYIGDCIYELYVRTYLVDTTNLKPHRLHIESIKYVKACNQAKFLNEIYEDLDGEEKDIVRRARNTNNHHVPKNASVQEYMYATAFEALIGYLYLNKNYSRVKEIIETYILKR